LRTPGRRKSGGYGFGAAVQLADTKHRGAQAQSCQAEADLELGWYLTETIAEISANCFESGFVLYPVERGGQLYPQFSLWNVRSRDRKCDAELHIGPALRMIIQ